MARKETLGYAGTVGQLNLQQQIVKCYIMIGYSVPSRFTEMEIQKKGGMIVISHCSNINILSVVTPATYAIFFQQSASWGTEPYVTLSYLQCVSVLPVYGDDSEGERRSDLIWQSTLRERS
jgi:hypothetical protein